MLTLTLPPSSTKRLILEGLYRRRLVNKMTRFAKLKKIDQLTLDSRLLGKRGNGVSEGEKEKEFEIKDDGQTRW